MSDSPTRIFNVDDEYFTNRVGVINVSLLNTNVSLSVRSKTRANLCARNLQINHFRGAVAHYAASRLTDYDGSEAPRFGTAFQTVLFWRYDCNVSPRRQRVRESSSHLRNELSLLNMTLQVCVVNQFLGGSFSTLGQRLLKGDPQDNPFELIFPKITKCLVHT